MNRSSLFHPLEDDAPFGGFTSTKINISLFTLALSLVEDITDAPPKSFAAMQMPQAFVLQVPLSW